MEVVHFQLVKPYRPALFRGASRELDAEIARLAAELEGRVTSRSTETLAGGRARTYRIVYGAAKTQEIAFVLSGDNEYELLCRRLVSQSDTPCRQFFASFAFANA